MSTIQEMFNTSVAGLAKQGFRRAVYISPEAAELSTGVIHGSCRFRDEGGFKCAVGHLITDEQIAVAAAKERASCEERGDLYSIREPPTDAVIRYGMGIEAKDPKWSFLLDLQSSHDYGYSPADMKNKLRLLAAKYGLGLPDELK